MINATDSNFVLITLLIIFAVTNAVKSGFSSPAIILVAIISILVPIKFLVLNNTVAGIPIIRFSGAEHIGSFYILVSVAVAIFSCYALTIFFKEPAIEIAAYPNTFVVRALILIIPACFVVAVVASAGLDTLNSPKLMRSFFERGGMSYISQIYQLAFGLFLFDLYYRGGRKIEFIFFASIFIGFSIILGRPAWVLSFLITVILLRNLFLKKNSIFAIFIGTTFFPIFAVYMLSFRRAASPDVPLTESAVAATEELLSFDALLLGEAILRRSDQFELFSNLAYSIDHKLLAPDPLFPLAFFSQFIPRAIWSDKPVNFSTHMTGVFDPAILAAGASNNYLGFGEFLYAFGFFGIILSGMLFGFYLFVLNQFWLAAVKDPARAVFPVLIWFPFVLQSFTSGFVNDWAIPALMINLFVTCFLCRVTFKLHPPSRR